MSFSLGLHLLKSSSSQSRLVGELPRRLCDPVTLNPQKPRLVKHGKHAEALAVISALDDKPYTHAEVQRTYIGIREVIAAEGGESGGASLKELFTHGRSQNFRRTALGVVNQCFQQITGINLIT